MGCFRSPLQQSRYPSPPRYAEGGDTRFNVVAKHSLNGGDGGVAYAFW
jgi:hypothetical protein